MHYRVYVPNAPVKHKLKAKCPFCGDASFVHDVNGLLMIGPIAIHESHVPTVIDSVSSVDDVSVFEIKTR